MIRRLFPWVLLSAAVAIFATFLWAAFLLRGTVAPATTDLFLAGLSPSVSFAGKDETGGLAFTLDVNPARVDELAPALDALFAAYSELAERELDPQDGKTSEADEGNLDLDRTLEGTAEEDDPTVPAPPEDGEEVQGQSSEDGETGPTGEESYPLVGALDGPLQKALESAWNLGILQWQLGLELPVRIWERPLLSFLAPDEESADRIKALLLRRTPEEDARFLLEELLSYTVLDAVNPTPEGVHRGFVQLDIEALDTLADSLCPLEPARADACRLLGLPREPTRQFLADFLDDLGETFRIQLPFYWKRRGASFFFSNSLEGLESYAEGRMALGPGKAESSRELPAMLPVDKVNLEEGGLLVRLRLARLQHNLLALLSSLTSAEQSVQPSEDTEAEDEAAIAGDLAGFLQSPKGEDFQGWFEDGVSGLTRWSSAVFLQVERRRDSVLARAWYDEPDVVKDSPESQALVKETVSAQFDHWLVPWLGERGEVRISWPSADRVMVEGLLEGGPKHLRKPDLFSLEGSDQGPL